MKKVILPKYNGHLINGEWYIVENAFCKSAKESLEDKLKKLILSNLPTQNANKSSQKTNN